MQRLSVMAIMAVLAVAAAASAQQPSLEQIRDDFAKAVDRVSTLSSDKGRAVKLALSNGKLTLSVNNPDSGSATEELPIEYGDDPLEIGFNARYLLDISQQLESGTAEFQLADPGSPTMVRDGKTLGEKWVLAGEA